MTDHGRFGDPFEVELGRVVRRLHREPYSAMDEGIIRELRALVQRLADLHARAGELPTRGVFSSGGEVSSPALLAQILRAVAFDAKVVADVEPFAADLADVRRQLSARS